MAKDSFSSSPFRRLALSKADKKEVQVITETIADANQERYLQFVDEDNSKVDRSKWKLIKRKDGIRIYLERPESRQRPSIPTMEEETPELEILLCVGSTPGRLDDVMSGLVAAYTTGPKGSALLSTVKEPTVKEPSRSVLVKWMELDLRLKSMGLVKSQDFVYVESTGIKDLVTGERLGYHVMHSVNFPQTHHVSHRARSQLSVCSFFRQESEDSVAVYIMAVMEPMSDKARRLVVPKIAKTLLTPLKFTRRRKMTEALGERYTELKKKLAHQNAQNTCGICAKPVRMWQIGKRLSSCQMCSALVCTSCQVKKELTFMTPDLDLTQQKVTFCSACARDSMTAPATSDLEAGGRWKSVSSMKRSRLWSNGSSSEWGSLRGSDPALPSPSCHTGPKEDRKASNASSKEDRKASNASSKEDRKASNASSKADRKASSASSVATSKAQDARSSCSEAPGVQLPSSEVSTALDVQLTPGDISTAPDGSKACTEQTAGATAKEEQDAPESTPEGCPDHN